VGLLRLGSSFGLGYVLGSRAGRQRYEQLLADGRRFLQHPKVREASSRLPAVVQQRLAAARGPEHGASGNTTAGPPVQAGAVEPAGAAGDETQTPPQPRLADPTAADFPEPSAAELPPRACGSAAAGAGGPVQQPAVDRPGGRSRPRAAALHPAQTPVATRRGPQRTAQPSGPASKVAMIAQLGCEAPAGPVDGRSGAAAPRACA